MVDLSNKVCISSEVYSNCSGDNNGSILCMNCIMLLLHIQVHTLLKLDRGNVQNVQQENIASKYALLT